MLQATSKRYELKQLFHLMLPILITQFAQAGLGLIDTIMAGHLSAGDLAAIAVGVGLFKGFEMLWANMSKIITALLAVAATGTIVGIVHALRTERDGLSMVLAGAAGLAVTFGPLAIVGL